jgi:hypothetical protein
MRQIMPVFAPVVYRLVENRTCLGPPGRGRLAQGGIAVPSVWGLSKEQANYRDAPTPAVQFKVCKFMFPPLAIGSCRFVRGVIEGSKTCDEFAPRKSGQTHP